MIKELMHDPLFLGRKSERATKEDIKAAEDLIDTITYHKEGCVGMAANMIGVLKRIIVFDDGGKYTLMFNPVILKKSGEYEAEEGCLSLLGGVRKTRRYKKIKVQYETKDLEIRIKNYEGFVAEIIQHEIDHCDGILI